MKVVLAFYKQKKNNIDKLISFISRGYFTHCEIYIPEYNTSYSASKKDNNRVRQKNADEMNFNDKSKWTLIEFECMAVSVHLFLKYFKSVENTPYSLSTIILNHLFRFPFKISKNLICSEFCANGLNILLDLKPELKDTYKESPTSLLTLLVANEIIKI